MTAPTERETLDVVRRILVEVLHVEGERVTSQARLREDLEMDSLDMVEVVSHVEDNLGHSVDDEAVENVVTVGDVVELVRTLSAERGVDISSESVR